MKILYSWLKEFLEISLPPEALAQRLTLSGAEVTALERLEGDWLFELEITPNRPDLLSHLGLAREVAAILGRNFHVPLWMKRELLPLRTTEGSLFRLPEVVRPPLAAAKNEGSFPITLEDSQECRRYVGIVIEGVQVRSSPEGIIQRLTRLGIRPVNNVVDVTNLCLLELGQPLHAFDLDHLQGPSIRVRRAVKGENLVTIDGETLQLTPELLVIADHKRPVALAGVMGGRDTEIRPTTRRVLLESAWFSPARIRKAVRDTRLSSESSYRFERGVDLEMVGLAALRAARLISKLASGTVTAGPMDVGEKAPLRRQIALSPRRAQAVLGMRIYPAQQKRFLERLGCEVSGSVKKWHVAPPSFRTDLKIAEDLYEELARLWGYDRCPATLAPVARKEAASWQRLEDPWVLRQTKIRQCLAACGLQEIVTHSLVNPQDHGRLGTFKSPCSLKNPLSLEYSVLRGTLLIGALQTVARNLNHKTAESFQLFELGCVYGEEEIQGHPPIERRTLSLLVAGTPSLQWGSSNKPLGPLYLKGIIHRLWEFLGVNLEEIVKPDHDGYSHLVGPALAFRSQKEVGAIGMVDPKILSAYEIPEGLSVAYAELDVEFLADASQRSLQIQPLSKIAPVARDLAIVVDGSSPHESILQCIKEAGKPLLTEASLFDLYRGAQVPAGKKSLAFRLSYSAGDRTLTDEEVASAHQKIVDSLKRSFRAILR